MLRPAAKPLGLPLARDRTAERRKSSAVPLAEVRRAPWVGIKDNLQSRRCFVTATALEGFPSAEEIVSELGQSRSQIQSNSINKMLRGSEREDGDGHASKAKRRPTSSAKRKKEDGVLVVAAAVKKKEEGEDGRRSKCLRSPKSVGAAIASRRGRGARAGPAVEQSLRARSPFSAGGRELFSPTGGERDKGLAFDLFKSFYRRDPTNASVDSSELLRLQNWCRSEGVEDVLPALTAGGVSKLSVLELLTQHDLLSLGLDEGRSAELMQRVRRLTVRTLSMSEEAMGMGLSLGLGLGLGLGLDTGTAQESSSSATTNPLPRVQQGHADHSRSRSRSPFAAGIVRRPVVREPAKVFVRYPPPPRNPAPPPTPASSLAPALAISPITRDDDGAGSTPLQRLLAQSMLKKKREAAPSLSLSPQQPLAAAAAAEDDEDVEKVVRGTQSGERDEEEDEEEEEGAEEESQSFTREALFPPKPAGPREVAVRTTLLEGLRLAFDEGSGDLFMRAWRQALIGSPGEAQLEFLLLLYFASWALRVDSPSVGARMSVLRDFVQRDPGAAQEAVEGLEGGEGLASLPPPSQHWPQSPDEAKRDALFRAVAAAFCEFSVEVKRRFAGHLERAGLAGAEMCTSLKILGTVTTGGGATRPASLPVPARWGAHGPALSGSGYGGYHHQHHHLFSCVRRAASASPSPSPLSSPSSSSSASPTNRSRSLPSSGQVASASFPYRTLSPQAAALALQLAAYQRGCRYELSQAAGTSAGKSRSPRPSMRRRTLSASPSPPSPSPEVSTPPFDSSSDLSHVSDHDGSQGLLFLSQDFKM